MPVASAASRRSRLEAAGLALIVACITGLYAYFGSDPEHPYLPFRQSAGSDYYPLLADGFLAGRLGFNVAPPPQLATLADPYDPLQRERAGLTILHDASYYKGRYYLYFGVSPVLVVFLPFRLLTGVHFSQNLATVLFCTCGYLACLGLFLGLRRRFFPACGAGTVWLGAVMLGLGNFCLPMLTRNGPWEVAISSAYCFSCLGYWLLFQAWSTERRRVLWLAAAGAAFGLAVGSRPHFVFCGAAACGLWLLQLRDRVRSGESPGWARGLRETAALFLPFGLIVVGLLVYNYLRFDHPFEFGIKYQLGGGSEIRATLASLEYWPVNLYYNFLARAQFERYFPFVEVIRGYFGVRPAGYDGAEDPYGLLPNMPFWLLALAAPIAWRFRFRQTRELLAWMGLFGLCFLILASAILSYAWATNRYEVDFIPPLLLLAALGLLMLGCMDGLPRAGQRLLQIGVASTVAYTAMFNVGAAFLHNGMFKLHHPETYRALGSWFNRPAFLWDEWSHQPYGPAELTVRFPQDRAGRVEPIMVTGTSYRSDYLYVYYYPDGRCVQLSYTRTNYGHQQSQPIALDLNVPHRIGIQSGTLYPPENHPYFAGKSADEIAAAKHTLRVTIDGIPYIEAKQEFFDTTPGFVSFGENNVSDYIERRFTGDILDVRREPAPPAAIPFRGGSFVRLGLVLPRGLPGRSEPLIATGSAGRGDLLFVTYSDDAHVRLGFHHSGDKPVFSRPIQIEPGDIQVLEASLGSFYPHPGNARERELAQMLIVRLNSSPIWPDEHVFHFYQSGDTPPAIGINSWKSDASGAAFSGRIVAQEPCQLLPVAPDRPLAFSPYWLQSKGSLEYGAIRLHLRLPPQRAPKPEPLVVTQWSPNQADFVFIGTPARGQVSLGYLHRGSTGRRSRRFPVDLAQPQVVEISIPSLYPPETDGYFARYSLAEINALKTRSYIKLNGETALNEPAPFLATPTDSVTIGENSQSEILGPRFTGKILAVERSGPNPPPGFDDQFGPVEIVFTLPEVTAGNENLLATGNGSAWDELVISHESPGQARFFIKTSQGRRFTSAPLPIDPAVRHTLRISWGGFYLDAARPSSIPTEQWRLSQQSAAVTLDGGKIFDERTEFVHANPETVDLGGAMEDTGTFSGLLISVRRLPIGAH